MKRIQKVKLERWISQGRLRGRNKAGAWAPVLMCNDFVDFQPGYCNVLREYFHPPYQAKVWRRKDGVYILEITHPTQHILQFLWKK